MLERDIFSLGYLDSFWYYDTFLYCHFDFINSHNLFLACKRHIWYYMHFQLVYLGTFLSHYQNIKVSVYLFLLFLLLHTPPDINLNLWENKTATVNFWLLTSPKSLFLNGVTANQNNVLSSEYFGHSNIHSKYVVVPTFCSMSSFLAFVKAAIFFKNFISHVVTFKKMN